MTTKQIAELEREIARLRDRLKYKGKKRDRTAYMREYQRKRRARLKSVDK